MRGDLPVSVSVDGRSRQVQATYSWAAGGRVLTFSTVLAEADLAVELISTYVGHADTATVATHLILGPIGHAAEIHTTEHEHEHLDPVERTRECAYDHAHQLISALWQAGLEAGVRLDESSFAQLDRVE